MVKIRYSELPAGLHVVAEACRHGTVVYLLPGLTPAQRRAALVRVRSSARMGHGPPMPTLSTALAVAADRTRTTTRNGLAALRRHPMVFLSPLVAVLASAIVFMLMSFVTLSIAPHDKAAAAAVPTLGIGAGQTADHGSHSAGPRAGQQKPGLSSSPRRSRRHRPAADPSASASGFSVTTPHLSPGSPALAHRSPPPSPSPSPSVRDRCIKLGPLRFCVRS
ncbi:MAG TPA: hypothetical protein VK836_07020 [Streptosporangiaceae bacterium]|nr:hypothetical protein [Streptosporangiaceae bacterium]